MLKALISDLLLHSYLTDGRVDVRPEGSPEETLAEHLRKAKKQKVEKTADEMPEMEQKGKEEEETQGQPEEDMDMDIDNKELPSTGTCSDPKPRACKRL